MTFITLHAFSNPHPCTKPRGYTLSRLSLGQTLTPRSEGVSECIAPEHGDATSFRGVSVGNDHGWLIIGRLSATVSTSLG